MGLLQATATNIIGMVGVGPFLTIPFMVAAMNGPHIIYAWIAGARARARDGLVYAQLGAALPGSGGGYLYLREAFQPFGLGRLMALPLHLPDDAGRAAVGRRRRGRLRRLPAVLLDDDDAAAAQPDRGRASASSVTALLWRDIEVDRPPRRRHAGRACWSTVGWVIVAGLFNFSPAQAFDFPPEARTPRRRRCCERSAPPSVLAMYNYGGYNQVCNIGEEITDPGAHDAALDRPLDRSSSPRSTCVMTHR